MCEGLLFTPEGKALHGITGGRNSDKDGVPGTAEDRRVEHVVPREAVERGTYELIVELSCNGMFGTGLNGYRHQQPDVSTDISPYVTSTLNAIPTHRKTCILNWQQHTYGYKTRKLSVWSWISQPFDRFLYLLIALDHLSRIGLSRLAMTS
jgi:hypothetical protein